jgi:hypothetical protein
MKKSKSRRLKLCYLSPGMPVKRKALLKEWDISPLQNLRKESRFTDPRGKKEYKCY